MQRDIKMIPKRHVEIFEEQMSWTSYNKSTTVFNSPSLCLLDDFLVQFEGLRVPLAEGGLGDEALGVGDGGRAGGAHIEGGGVHGGRAHAAVARALERPRIGRRERRIAAEIRAT